ncbi:DUF748 domain-containing protein [Propionivibrio dicarboxylicus]|uniref:DUF748 domain-containing protein n=1 Tax=Propionivibrio dicarboxylicus TaxID=83767 RepID=A0A1G7Y7V4_9RHOO|nr:DUF748 domain-containing protein [Propionivibrio dicarboxylicus]SDG92437.1 protein of unknown function [Propionivibrio dicarboxylicus]
MRSLRWPLISTILVALLVAGGFAGYQTAVRTLREQIERALGPDGEAREIRVDLTGIELIDLRFKAPADATWSAGEPLRADRVFISPDYINLIAGKRSIDTVRIENARLAVLRTRQGKLIVLPGLAGRAAAPGAANTPANARNPDADVFIRRIEIVGSTLELVDASVRTPPQVLRLEQINAAIGRVRLPSLTGVSTIDLVAALKGPKENGTLSITGTAELATRESGLTVRLRSLDLVALQPYLLKAGEGGVKTGSLDLDINASVRQGLLHAPGTLTLRNLNLATMNGTLMGMPRQAVVNLMKRRDGSLRLRFVLEGRLDDPQLALNEKLARQLASALAAALGTRLENFAREVDSLGGKAIQELGNSLGKAGR